MEAQDGKCLTAASKWFVSKMDAYLYTYQRRLPHLYRAEGQNRSSLKEKKDIIRVSFTRSQSPKLKTYRDWAKQMFLVIMAMNNSCLP